MIAFTFGSARAGVGIPVPAAWGLDSSALREYHVTDLRIVRNYSIEFLNDHH